MAREVEDSFDQETEITEKIWGLISAEVEKDVAPIESSEDKSWYSWVMMDLRLTEYKLLSWIKNNFNHNLLLYPASGHDRTPKLVFGIDKVVHTSLENRRKNFDKKKYFRKLGAGERVIADNQNLPFENETFDGILLLDSQDSSIGKDTEKYLQQLKNKGLLILYTPRALCEDDERIEKYSQIKELQKLKIPKWLEKQGDVEMELAVFRKTS